MQRICLAIVLFATASTALAQRKPDAPDYVPPKLPDTVADDAFRKAFRDLGYMRIAIVTNVHTSDVIYDSRTHVNTKSPTTQTSEHRIELGVINKEDQTNAWRILRGLKDRLNAAFRHREIRSTLLGLEDMGDAQALELRALCLRDEGEAARQIGKKTGADLVLCMTLSKAVEADANGARYGASYFLADVKRNEMIDNWSWDMKPDGNGAYPAPLLGMYAMRLAMRTHDELLRYAGQAAASHGRTLRYQTLKFVGLPTDLTSRLKDAIGHVEHVRVLRSELETENSTPVASFEIESALDSDKLADAVRQAAADALGSKVTLRAMKEGTIEYGVEKVMEKPADKPQEKATEKPAEKSADKPADKSDEKPADKPGDKP